MTTIVLGLIAFVVMMYVMARAWRKVYGVRKKIDEEIRLLEIDLGEEAEKATQKADEVIKAAKIKRLAQLYIDKYH